MDAEALSRVLAAVERGEADGWNAVRVLRDRDQTTGERVEVGGLPFSPKAGLRLGFWHHQFLRVRVLAIGLAKYPDLAVVRRPRARPREPDDDHQPDGDRRGPEPEH